MKTKKSIVLKSNIEHNKKNESIFYKLIFSGDSGVGKTQIINVYNKKLFQNDHLPTFGIDFQIKTLNIIGKKANIHCIDTAGSEDFSEDTGKLFVKKADAFILVYDITSKESFYNLYKYYNIFKIALNDIEEKYSKKVLYMVGNKFDLRMNRLVNENEARQMANKYEAKYLEVSAKSGFNIDMLFELIIKDILRRGECNSNVSYGQIKGNNIYKNINSIRSIDSLKNTNNSENESASNIETSSNFLKSKNNYLSNYNYNNDYINKINNFQENQNNEKLGNSFYYNQNNNYCNYNCNYNNSNNTNKCLIF